MASDAQPASYRWEQEVDGTWCPVDPAILPEWVKSKKSVRFAAAGGILRRRKTGQTEERYRLVRR